MLNGLLIDYEWCSGCHSCEVACKEEHGFPVGKHGIRVYQDGPWVIEQKQLNWNKIPVPTDLCDLCADRVAKGRKPTCMHHCLASVIKFGPVDELALDLAKKPRQVLFVPDADRARTLIPRALEPDTEYQETYLGLRLEDVETNRAAGTGDEDNPGEYEANESFRVAQMRYDNQHEDKSDQQGWV